MPNIISAFSSLDCSKNIYWGTSMGITYHFPYYFRGLGYALSWPLVRGTFDAFDVRSTTRESTSD